MEWFTTRDGGRWIKDDGTLKIRAGDWDALRSGPLADGGGRRDNSGKLRLDLIPADVIEALAQVLTDACTKRQPPYPERNWERGMPWSSVVGSLERHLLDLKLGRRVDKMSGLRASALLLCNAVFLCAYDLRGMDHLDDLEPFARAAAQELRRAHLLSRHPHKGQSGNDRSPRVTARGA